MDTTIPCPGCGTRLNLEDTGCPICLRGRSPQEITRGYQKVRADAARRRRRPLVVTAWVAGLAAAGYVGITYQTEISSFLHAVSARFGHFYDENSDPAYIAPDFPQRGRVAAPPAPRAPEPAPSPEAAPPVVTVARAAPAAPAALAAAMAAKRPAPATTPSGPRASAPEPALPHAESSQWVLHGRAYDLSTLEPVGRVLLNIRMGEGAVGSAFADENGYFSTVLPRPQEDNDGFIVENRDPRYATAVQQEGDIPYRKLPASERLRLIQSAQENDVHSSPIRDVEGQEDVRRDVFLSPRH